MPLSCDVSRETNAREMIRAGRKPRQAIAASYANERRCTRKKRVRMARSRTRGM